MGNLATRQRRTRADMRAIRAAIAQVLDEEHPMTIRQVFYQLVSRGVVAKKEGEYKATVGRLLAEMRLDGEIPFDRIADNTRWMRKPRTHRSLESALRLTAETYRRSLWERQDAYVEVWLEKDALAGVLLGVTDPWDVPLMVTRGYPSLSFLHSAAEMIGAVDKPTFLYYLGDHDPSGLDIPRAVEEGLRRFAPAADITFERVAVTPEQIATLGLPTRPTKSTDSRSKGFQGGSVEVDAIPPRQLRQMVERLITGHVDERSWRALQTTERQERETLRRIAENYAETWDDYDEA